MPTSLWPITSSGSINLQPQFTPTHTSYPQISAVNTFTQPNRTQYHHPQTTYQQYPSYTQPYTTPPWPRGPPTWPKNYTLEYQPQQYQQPHTLHHPYQGQNPLVPPDPPTDRSQFAQSFSKGLKLEFPRFDGENPSGWLRQAEKCITLAATPLDQRVHHAEIFLTDRANHWLRSTGINTESLSL
jgi:hypothetical protein